MKRRRYTWWFTGLFVFACVACSTKTKELITPNTDKSVTPSCVEQVDKPPQHTVTDAELSVIRELFSRNSLATDNLAFTKFLHDELGYYHVFSNQWQGHTPFFYGQLNFHFYPDKTFSDTSGDQISGVNLPPITPVSKEDIGQSFLNQVHQDGFQASDLDSLDQTCIEAQYGMYDLHAGTGNQSRDFAWTWRVSFRNREYPFALYQAATGTLIFYDNGIRTTH